MFLVAFVQRDDPGASKHLGRTHVSLNRTTSIVIVFETVWNSIEKGLSKSAGIGSYDVGSEGLWNLDVGGTGLLIAVLVTTQVIEDFSEVINQSSLGEEGSRLAD